MAGAGFKTFNTGDVLTAADVNTYLMQQTVMVFDSSTARSTALGANVAEGMLSYLKDTDQVEVYNGTSWVASDDPNAIQNSIVDAKGDLITATADNVPARIGVGTNGQVLTADSTTSTGLKWATVSSGGITQLATGTLSGTSVTLSSISQSYKHLQLVLQNPKMNSSERVGIRWNGSSATYVTTAWIWDGSGTYTSSSQAYGTWQPVPTSNDNLHCFIEFLDYTYAGRQIIRATVNDQPNTQGHVNMRYNNNDSAAITEITIRTFNGTATFSGGTYTLFGVA